MSAVHDARLPLAAGQREIWLAQQLNPTSVNYRVGEYLEIHGPVDPAVFDAAVRQVVAETESLHARFGADDGVPWQVLDPVPDWTMPMLDVSAEPDPLAAAQDWMWAELATPLDLTEGQLFRYALFRLGPNRFAWYHGYHHIVLDGMSAGLLARRVTDRYTALLRGEPVEPTPPGALRLLVDRDAAYRSSAEFAADQRFWLERFVDRPQPIRLDGQPGRSSARFLRESATLEPELLDQLRVAAAHHGVRWSALGIAATAGYLHRATNAQDVIFGLPVKARVDPALRDLACSISTIVPLRIRVRPETSLGELVGLADAEVRQVLPHQRYQIQDLVRVLSLGASGAAYTAVQVNIMAFHRDLRAGEHRVTAHNLINGPVDDLSILLFDQGDGRGVKVDVDGNPSRHSSADLNAHLRRFCRLLAAFADTAQAAQPIASIDLTADHERDHLAIS